MKETKKTEQVKVEFKVSNVDESGNQLTSAEFVLTDADGNGIVTQWTSDTTVKDLSSVLVPGKSYVLTLKKTSENYETSQLTFRISVTKKDGTVSVDGKALSNGTLTIVNKKKSTSTDTNKGSNTGTSNKPKSGATAATDVKTADETNTLPFVLAEMTGLICMIGAPMLLIRRRRDQNGADR